MAPQLTVIIPTRNRSEILLVSLRHLYQSLEQLTAEVIVVNDGDYPIEEIRKAYTAIIIIANSGRGVAAARNSGARIASSELLLFMDDDMWMSPAALHRMIEFHSLRDHAALNVNWTYPPLLNEALTRTAFGRYLVRNQFVSLRGWNKDTLEWEDERCFKTSAVTSQNLSIRKSSFIMVGGYNEDFPHAGFEDYEFSKKLNGKGIEIFIDPTVMTWHNEADRMALAPWMERRQRGGETRRVAVGMGYGELTLNYTGVKRIAFSWIARVQPILGFIATRKFVDQFVVFDYFSFLIFEALFAASIYKGYTGNIISKKS